MAILDSTILQKTVAALTGLGLIAFLVGHLGGNLLVFVGADALNAYAAKLKDLGWLLWAARIGLIGVFAAHIAITIRLKIRNRHARGKGYARETYQESTRSSRWMALSGTAILAFVLFHLAHFTLGWVQPEFHAGVDGEGRHDVFQIVVAGFQNWLLVAIYLVGLALVGSHVGHASFSILRTLGIVKQGNDSRLRSYAKVAAVALTIGFLSIPLAVLIGIVG